MIWSDLLLGELPLSMNIDFCIRMLLACACGAAIGVERSRHFKDAASVHMSLSASDRPL